MALFLIGRFEGCRPELFQTKRFAISVSSLAMDYITWSSMNVNRDTVNDFILVWLVDLRFLKAIFMTQD